MAIPCYVACSNLWSQTHSKHDIACCHETGTLLQHAACCFQIILDSVSMSLRHTCERCLIILRRDKHLLQHLQHVVAIDTWSRMYMLRERSCTSHESARSLCTTRPNIRVFFLPFSMGLEGRTQDNEKHLWHTLYNSLKSIVSLSENHNPHQHK